MKLPPVLEHPSEVDIAAPNSKLADTGKAVDSAHSDQVVDRWTSQVSFADRSQTRRRVVRGGTVSTGQLTSITTTEH